MKKIFCIVALIGLVGSALLTSCKKDETTSIPAVPATNAPATNAPAQ
jgi:hypothetical protein